MVFIAFALLLVVLAIAFAWHNLRALRLLKPKEQMPPEDWRYYRRQSYRRLFGCGLMVLLAALLIGLFFVDQELDQFGDRGEQAQAQGVKPDVAETDKDALSFYLLYTFTVIIVVLVLLGVALIDLMAIRRFGMRHRKRIREDREGLLQRQLSLLRRSKNGHD